MKMSECKYCQMIENRKNLLYEDENIIAIVPEKPITNGHVQIITKKHHKNVQEMENLLLQEAFYAASFSASSLFEILEAHGTNIIANTGGFIKEKGHFHIDVLSRKSGDDLNFIWKPNEISEEDMKQVQEKIKDKCDMIGIKKEKQIIDLDKKKVEELKTDTEKPIKKEEHKEEKYQTKNTKEDIDEEKESYLVKQLRRMP
jgi:histidine triad (HIT) family protein